MASYHHLASFYDKAMNHVKYDHWTNFLLSIFQKERLNINRIVDLGCGTGEITVQLARKGFKMTGIDISSEMLSMASQKSNNEKLSMIWLQQDIRKLNGFSNEELFISFFDVMNYITDKEELINTFQIIYDSLGNNGYFIFDVHHFEHVTDKLIGHRFAHDDDDFAYIWDCIEGSEIGEMYHQMTFFVQSTGKYYEKFTEDHHQKTWKVEQYKEMLKNVGYSKVDFYSDFKIENTILQKNDERIFIVAKK